ncbi:urea ABC transporter permease subunit UrtB [Ahrensia kielensis]|uniref:urea ABC transporter permease subunit UrtB n=1 Tax=Ahrensia kielensis TaxID=76980 RepID=UPI000367CA1D|nr:urea ABC transporter permease subunit UrtB [Ahrensia kielensis]
MFRILIATVMLFITALSVSAQSADLQTILQENSKAVERSSRTTISPILDALLESESTNISTLLENWQSKKLWMRKSDGLFFFVENSDADPIELIDIESNEVAGTADKSDLKELRPNSGVRAVMASTLVRFQLIDEDQIQRTNALTAIERDPDESHLDVLRGTIADEPVTAIKTRMERLERLLTIRFDKDSTARVDAITHFAGDTNIDVRAVLNPILATQIKTAKEIPETENVAQRLSVGNGITHDAAYQLLVDNNLAPQRITTKARDAALVANIADGKIGGFDVASLNTEARRIEAYQALASKESVPPFITEEAAQAALDAHVFYDAYIEQDSAVTDAARNTVRSINTRVGAFQVADLGLDALSLASIYFLAAIGLAITFGVMGVINMAHGEFIMIGAYTGYVAQQLIPDYTLSLIVALPLAFVVAFGAGVALERLVIRHLMHRPLETLLATFGISIALQQLAKNIFGTQARPLTSPAWLDGAWVYNDIVSISYIRIAIFVLALLFFALLLFILNRTRLGLEVRAVTQNPRMASSMGINPDKINMLTFGLGSGIAGIAGVAIGLFGQVTSELGSNYIVQSFMTVVVGGVGNIWGTLAGASMIGGLQKIIEFFNPSNTLAAQTFMIIFIIIFIQFRPKGIIALKGRAAGD